MTHHQHQMPEEYYKLLLDLQAVDFVLVELNLYLDTHPTDRKAIEQYNLYAHKKQQLKQQFDANFGPLQGFGNSYSKDPFEWGKAPWPWQV
ncbi:spore coat protein JB [Tumebacillus sp. BK434]|uniref:spore coat protein CotJB n=1 Tax=Tumebacillus sp. BK434 TaxID=2512169 RepID=UPI0010491236|nr:spore coat protein CotJB [Tumebacillus sp. BK434]TCP55456.1 spore coat protein JB [Tumebacillus sp. BK434]